MCVPQQRLSRRPHPTLPLLQSLRGVVGAKLAWCRVQAGIEHAALVQGEQALLADPRFRFVPGFCGRVPDQRRDPQPELQRRVHPAERFSQGPEPADEVFGAHATAPAGAGDVAVEAYWLGGRGRP